VKVILVEPGGFGTGIWEAGHESFPAPPDSAYAHIYDRAKSATLKGKLFPDPIWVGRAIRLALATPVPLPRYLVGVDAVAMAVSDGLAPTVVSDYVKAASAGLRSIVPSVPFLRR
jgi:hypothetical protein